MPRLLAASTFLLVGVTALHISACAEEASSKTRVNDDASDGAESGWAEPMCEGLHSRATENGVKEPMPLDRCIEKMTRLKAKLSPTDWNDFKASLEHLNLEHLEEMVDSLSEME